MIVESSTSNDMVVREGSNVTMHCNAKGYPEPFVRDFQWMNTLFKLWMCFFNYLEYLP